MNIGDLLVEREHSQVRTIHPQQFLREAAGIMMGHNVGALAVVDEDNDLIDYADRDRAQGYLKCSVIGHLHLLVLFTRTPKFASIQGA